MGYRREVLNNKKGLGIKGNEVLSIRLEEIQGEVNSSFGLIESMVMFEGILLKKIERAKKNVEDLKNWIITFLILHVITAFLLGWFIGRVLEISGL